MARSGSLIEFCAISYQSRKQKAMVRFWEASSVGRRNTCVTLTKCSPNRSQDPRLPALLKLLVSRAAVSPGRHFSLIGTRSLSFLFLMSVASTG